MTPRQEFESLRRLHLTLRFLELQHGDGHGIARLRAFLLRKMAVLAAALCVTLIILPALAQEHKHPDQTIYGATAKFYESWMRPDMPYASCCNRADCDVAVDVKNVQGRWWARKKSGGPLVSIPAEKIEQNRDSPDGQSHLCAIGPNAICFLPASGG